MEKQRMTLEVVVPGHPVGKGRARSFVRKNGPKAGSIGHITPQKTRSYEATVRLFAAAQMQGRAPIGGPVRLTIRIVVAVPGGWPSWKKEAALAGRIRPTVKPDADNVEKAIKDALNGVAWVDDCQVVETDKVKIYANAPRVEMVVVELPELPAHVKTRAEMARS